MPEDVYVFLRQRIDQLGLKRFIKPADLGQFLDDLKNFFDRCHEELVGPKEFQEYVNCLKPGPDMPRNCRAKDVEEIGDPEILERWQEIARVYTNSMRLLERENLGTFGMMIRNAVRLLEIRCGIAGAREAQSAFHPDRRISGLQLQQHHPGAASCRRRAEHFCRRRSGPGHLPFSRGIERGV